MKPSLTGRKAASHMPRCQCPDCLSGYDQRQSAAAQLYALLDMRWVGLRAAVTYAEFARQGIEEAFPPQAQAALGYLRQTNAGLLNNLISDILD